jgi:3-phytase
VYNLDGSLRQKITNPSGFWGNVDVRGNLVVAAKNGMMIYRVDAARSQPLVAAKEASGHAATWGEGLCLYDAGAPGLSGGLYGINNVRDTYRVRVHPLTDGDGDGLLTIGRHIREFYLGSEVEGCVVDDASGHLFISEEDVAIWRYDLKADGTGAPPRVRVDAVGSHLAPDIEGLALAGRYLIASAQNVNSPWANWYNIYDKVTSNLVRQFRVTNGSVSDDCDQTDGIAATTAPLGANFPGGLFVCQDGINANPTQNQSFKFTRLERVLP